MKRTLLAIVLGMSTLVAMAQERTEDEKKTRRLPFTPMSEREQPPDEAELKAMLFERGALEQQRIHIPLWWAKDVAEEYNIPHERMVGIVEDMIRKRLKNSGKRPANEYPGQINEMDEHPSVLSFLIMDLQGMHGPSTLALLKECVEFPDKDVRHHAVITYIFITDGGGDSVPFLRESIAKGLFSEEVPLYSFLGKCIAKLKEKGQTEDVEKLHGFMLERLETEPEHHNLEQLDRVLCATLEGYEKSPRHKVAVERIATLKQKERTERHEQETKEKEEGKSSP